MKVLNKRNVKGLSFGRESDLRLQAFRFLKLFFAFPFSPFFFLSAAVIDLPLGLLAIKKLLILRKRHRDGQFLPWKFCSEFFTQRF